MAVNFKKLQNKQEDRNIRAVIMNGSESILVYEPSLNDVDEILQAQEGWVSVEEGVNITEEDVLRKLIPMLTNIEGIDEMSDEEIRDVANNPTVALLSVQSEIESIIVEIYRHITVLARRQLQNADFEFETMLAQRESFDRTISMATKYGDNKDLPKKLQQAVDNLTQAYSSQEQTEEGDAIINQLNSLIAETGDNNDENKVLNLASMLDSASKSEKAINNDLDLGDSITDNSVKKDDKTKDVFTSDKSKNLTEMIKKQKSIFEQKGSNSKIKLD